MDAYEERLAIIAEGRDVQPEDISAAWESALNVKLSTALPKNGVEFNE